MTMAGVIQEVQRPTLVIAHNKTLAAQLCNEFRTFFPDNAVEYFVSYYDYYQPEAYVPSRDLYIEKDSAINQEVDRLRHAATAAVFARRDVIVVASVSCIYGLGSPETYEMNMQILRRGEEIDRDAAAAQTRLDPVHAQRQVLSRGSFRVRGETLEVFPAYAETAYPRDAVRRRGRAAAALRPADGRADRGRPRARRDLAGDALQRQGGHDRGRRRRDRPRAERALRELESEGKLLESHRLRQRTQYDMEMLREMGFCSGIENYSRILDGRAPGERPYCLIDYFPKDFVCFIDESHQTVPQIGGMFEGDRSRKQTLVDYGFRLPSAMDNRPQRFEEFLSITPQLLFVSATPGEYERTRSTSVVEQIVRPTGIVDPSVEVRETKNQIDDLMNEVRKRVERNERVLVTTLTKKMSEDLSQYLLEMGFKTRYLHSEIDTLERIQIIRDLRLGEYDVLVGVNLLREGLDLPEVSLVAILDADKEGFLRGETSLIQTIGRAARNIDGHGADVRRQGDEGDAARRSRRPTAGARSSSPTTRSTASPRRRSSRASPTSPSSCSPTPRCRKGPQTRGRRSAGEAEEMPEHELEKMVVELEEEMIAAAEELRFEYAAQLRDELRELRRDLREIQAGEAPAAPERRRRAAARPIAMPQRRTRPAHSLGWPRVEIDRQAIERRDFPIARRGYEPASVDAHLRALASEIEAARARALDRRPGALAGDDRRHAGAEHPRGRRGGRSRHRAPSSRRRRDDARAGRARRGAHARGRDCAGARARRGRRAGDGRAARARRARWTAR